MTSPRFESWVGRCGEARDIPVLEIVGRLNLGEPKRSGKQHRIHCPFHDDRRPSLWINARKGVWYCHPCGFGGDGLDLWQRVRGVGFADAVRELTG